ncbi:1-deoxy-D-xylulose-5-phosphate reductoisomerase [Kutzneria kofuensis]|uniref:1-deoxy-D-xylulose-5-phosphate reductoisomerase n=1 Tax=Kutzneria kofuensis TaxID=103725 RepID=UPI001608F962|nr:1-deoxy-D-xylulose-5-phosphate reductoisomerase [Kutzneria kofuensis]
MLGSTGSIGAQALDVVEARPDQFWVAGISSSGRKPAVLACQALNHNVDAVAVTDPAAVDNVRLALRTEAHRRGNTQRLPRILSGPHADLELIDSTPVDVVLNALPGSQGLRPSLLALGTGARLALANKESLVAGGSLVLKAAKPGQLVSVDSEHSALAQCLRGGAEEEVARLVLTASGGPFRGRRRAELARVTVGSAMAHPTWSMGPLITINSATLVNKGLEVIEAHLLFDVPYDRIDVVVHPQSVIHSMVTFVDGSTLAQASPPDMRLPISLALGWPARVAGAAQACDWSSPTSWTFEPLDDVTFPAVELARFAGATGGCLPAVYNAANEECVAAFLAGATSFLSIVDTVAEVVGAADQWHGEPADVSEVLAAEGWARTRAAATLARAA